MPLSAAAIKTRPFNGKNSEKTPTVLVAGFSAANWIRRQK